MKKITLFATALLLTAGIAFAQEKATDKKKTETKECCKKDGKDCCKKDAKDKDCCKKDEAKKTTAKPAPKKA